MSPQPPPLRLPPGARVALGFIVVTIVALLAVVVVLAARGFVAERTLYYASVAALLLSSLGPSTSLISSWRRGHPIRAYRSALRQLATQLGGQLVRDTSELSPWLRSHWRAHQPGSPSAHHPRSGTRTPERPLPRAHPRSLGLPRNSP